MIDILLFSPWANVFLPPQYLHLFTRAKFRTELISHDVLSGKLQCCDIPLWDANLRRLEKGLGILFLHDHSEMGC